MIAKLWMIAKGASPFEHWAVDRALPGQRPRDAVEGYQKWRTLLFLHWEVDPDAVAATLPPGLSVDTFEGKAYIGVVAFLMRDVRAKPWAPAVPTAKNFLELNVRTYVAGGGEPGVWFYSLDAQSSLAVVAARAGWHLPYHRATMRLRDEHGTVQYDSRRRWPGPKPAELSVTYDIGQALGPTQLGTLEHFLAERYLLFANPKPGVILRGQVHHVPYPLCAAKVREVSQTMTDAAGFSVAGAPHALYSPGVDVELFALRKTG